MMNDPALTVVFDDPALTVVLSVLSRYTSLALRLQRPMLRPLARQAFHAVSLGRGSVSGWLTAVSDGRHSIADDIVAARLGRVNDSGDCFDDACDLPRLPS